jgi:hypothetical protein
VGDLVRISVHPEGASADTLIEAETTWEVAPGVGERVVVWVPDEAVTRFDDGADPRASAHQPT